MYRDYKPSLNKFRLLRLPAIYILLKRSVFLDSADGSVNTPEQEEIMDYPAHPL